MYDCTTVPLYVHVSVLTSDPPRMIPTTLVESLGVENPHDYVSRSLVPYFAKVGVGFFDGSRATGHRSFHGAQAGSSGNLGQPRSVDDLVGPSDRLPASVQRAGRQVGDFLGAPIEDYERDIAAQSKGLERVRSAWNDGREAIAVDLLLVVLTIKRLRTPQAGRFRLSSLQQSPCLLYTSPSPRDRG